MSPYKGLLALLTELSRQLLEPERSHFCLNPREKSDTFFFQRLSLMSRINEKSILITYNFRDPCRNWLLIHTIPIGSDTLGPF